MDTVPVWVVLVVLGAIGSLAMLLWRGSDKRHDKHSESIADHEKRLSKIEEKVHNNEVEIAAIRSRYHDIVNDVSHSLASWYTEIVKMIRGKE